MAVKHSFKQQCPSCEAMVPIRDPGLIGRKIDCPKCKYRFVVEEPPEEAEDEAPAGAAKKSKPGAANVTNKKPVNGKAKPALKRRGEEDEDEWDDRPKKKKSGGSGMLILGISLAAVAVVALAVGAWLLFGGESSSSSSSGPSASVTPATNNEVKEEKKDKSKEEVKPLLPDATNYLPNDTRIVINLPMDRLLSHGAFKQALLQTPGSFRESAFQQTWGFPATDLARVVMAFNDKKKTLFTVMQTVKPVKQDQIIAGLKLKAEAPINGLNYYLLAKPLDSLSTFLLKGSVPHAKFALHFIDNQTLVCADLGPMQEFLQAKGKPKYLTQPPAKEEQPQGGGMMGGMMGMQGGPPGGMMGMQGGPPGGMMGMQGGPQPPGGGEGGGPPGGAPPVPGGKQPPLPGGGQPPGGMAGGPQGFQPPGGFPPGMMPPGMAPGGGSSNAAEVSSSYLTVAPELKAVLDQVEKTENKDRGVLLSFAMQISDTSVADIQDALARQSDAPKGVDLVGVFLRLQLGLEWKDIKTVGVGVTEFSDARISAAVAAGTKDEKLAQSTEKKLSDKLPIFVALTGLDLVAKTGGGQGNVPGMPPGMQMPPGMMQGMMPGMMQGMQPGMMQGMQPPAGMMGGGQQRGGAFPPGMMPPGMMPPGMMPPGMMPPGMQQPGGEGDKKEEKGKDGDYAVWSKDKVLALGANVNIKEAYYLVIAKGLEAACMALKGQTEMSDHRSHIHELAAATQAYLQKEGHFPRGARSRAPSADRVIDWRPDQRLSWMVDLLPYVANGEYKDLPIDNEKSWNEPLTTNVQAGFAVIPQFLSPMPPDKPYAYYVPYSGLKGARFAATHFVGIAGVGLDAAEYRADDPATAKLRGIFGYDRETKPDDIKDGLENTILLLQVPLAQQAPWIAGGGSTVRGVSEDLDCVQPFVCTEYQGKRGTFAIMADGKVRFIPATIDPKIFQAMCTIAGGERIKDIDAVAPEVPPPEQDQQPELKAEQPAQPAPPPVPPAGTGSAPVDARTKAIRTNDLKQIGLAYHNHLDSKKRPPAKIEDLAPFYENNAKITAAVKDGTYVVFWNVSILKLTAGTSNTVLAYERETPEKGGLVLMADGSVKTMTAKQFQDTAKPPSK